MARNHALGGFIPGSAKNHSPMAVSYCTFPAAGVQLSELSMALSRQWCGNLVNRMSAAAKYWISVIVNKNVFKKWFGLKFFFF
jgi:hypothetical protein